MRANQEAADKLDRPSCQDTGVIQYFLQAGANFPLLVLLCHKRSRTFTVAQYGQCPKALASATLN